MKLEYDIKNKKGNLEVDAEKLVEKGIEHNERTWKDKFITKHSAKKEMAELKHKQKLETAEKMSSKKNWFQKVEEEKRKTKELELAELRIQEEEKRKAKKTKLVITMLFGLLSVILMVIGSLDGVNGAIGAVGLFTLIATVIIGILYK